MQDELQAPGAKSGLGRCQPPEESRMNLCLLRPCLQMIDMDGMQNVDDKDKDNDDNVDGTHYLSCQPLLSYAGEASW